MFRIGSGREQRKVVEARSDSAGRVAARLQLREYRPGATDDGGWKPGELGDRDSVAAVGGAFRHLVQKHEVSLPLAGADVVKREAVEPSCEPRQLMIVGREQGPATDLVVHGFDHRPGDRE